MVTLWFWLFFRKEFDEYDLKIMFIVEMFEYFLVLSHYKYELFLWLFG